MQAEAVAQAVGQAPDDQLRLRVLAPDERHLRATGRINGVAHGWPFLSASTWDVYTVSSL
jgi:hypothetical protein